MKLKIENAYHCPPGKWLGRCESIEEPKKPVKDRCKNQVRLTFSVETDEGYKRVGRTFCADLTVGSELYCFLNSWLGGNLEEYRDEDGMVDLDLFVDMEALLYIVHGHQTAEYSYPVVLIAGIYPPRQPEDD